MQLNHLLLAIHEILGASEQKSDCFKESLKGGLEKELLSLVSKMLKAQPSVVE